MRDYPTVLVGFGVTGASAARLLLDTGVEPLSLAAVDTHPDALAEAVELGVVVHAGDGTTRAVLLGAIFKWTRCVIVTIGPDEAAVMATMIARELAPGATVVTAIRDPDHVARAVRAGADRAYATPEWTGRALALSLLR